MFQIKFLDQDLQNKFLDLETNFPPEVCQELPQFIEALRQCGQVSKVDFHKDFSNKISAHTFDLDYVAYPNRQLVVIVNIQVKSQNIFKDRFSVQDSWNDKDVIDCIPQYDKPSKIIRAVELTSQGITDSYQLGLELGHKGKQKRYITRHGQYAQSALEQLKLIRRERQGRKTNVEITEKGELIAKAPDEDTKKRLLIEAMLNYRPIWMIIGEVTDTEGDKELCDEFVKKLVFPQEDQEADTSNRRAQTLKNWIKWIAKYSGIPVRIKDQPLQLTIPLLFAEPMELDSDENF
ncbi:hypothetical protein NDI39_25535 [Microcoleus sp. ZQ-A2]|nr:hypothetical protein [Microcoleus sp. FACHB-1]